MSIGAFQHRFRAIWGLAACAAVGPVAARLSGLDPPWPSGQSAAIATIFCLGGTCLAFVSPHRISERSRSWLSTAGILAGLLAAVLYVWAYARFVVIQEKYTSEGPEIIRTVTGSELLPGVDHTMSARDLLLDHEFDEDRVWTAVSLLRARLVVLGSFIGVFLGLTSGIALLAAPGTNSPRHTSKH